MVLTRISGPFFLILGVMQVLVVRRHSLHRPQQGLIKKKQGIFAGYFIRDRNLPGGYKCMF